MFLIVQFIINQRFTDFQGYVIYPGAYHKMFDGVLNTLCCVLQDYSKFVVVIKSRFTSHFSAPEPKAQVHYCDHALFVVRPSVVNFSHFRHLLWNHWTEFHETWQEARSQRLLPSLCFSGWSEKQDGRPGLWLAETYFTSPLKPLKGIQRNLTGSKISTSSTKFVFFGPIGKTRWPPWPLIGWDIFDFFSETAEGNSTKLDKKQDLNVLYQVCVFRADRKNKAAALASDWLRHFRLLLWNRWGCNTQFRIKSKGYFPKLKIVWSGFPLFTCINDWNSTNF